MLDELKDEIDLEAFFQAMGAKKFRKSSRGYLMRCIHPNHNDSGPSMHYKLTTHKFYCYGCGFQGDIIDIVEVVKGLKFRKAIRWLRNFAGWSETTTTKQLQAIIERRQEQRRGGGDGDGNSFVADPAYFKTDFSGSSSDVRSYLKRRGWSEDVLASLGVGYCERGYFRDRIVFPVYDRDANGLCTFAARSIHDAVEPKYLYPLDSYLARSIWPLHIPLDSTPIFVEGAPDAMRLREYGYNGYACLGNQLGETKLELIRKNFKHHKTLIIIPDNDRGGQDMLSWFAKLVHEFEIMVARVKGFKNSDGEAIKDLDELGLEHGSEAVRAVLSRTIPLQDVYIEDKYKCKSPPKMVTDLVNEEPDEVYLESADPTDLMTSLYRVVRASNFPRF